MTVNWETRWAVVTPLLTFFGGKLLATGYLLWRLTHATANSGGYASWLLISELGLGCLAASQVFVMAGLMLHWKSARRTGDRLCVVGAAFGFLIAVIAPIFWMGGYAFLILGLLLSVLNLVALFAIWSPAMQEWCDVGEDW